MMDYTTQPKSVAELRATKLGDAKFWGPRDVLVSLLRELDSGELEADMIFVALGKYEDDPVGGINTKTSFRTAGPNHYAISGLLERARWMFQSD